MLRVLLGSACPLIAAPGAFEGLLMPGLVPVPAPWVAPGGLTGPREFGAALGAGNRHARNQHGRRRQEGGYRFHVVSSLKIPVTYFQMFRGR